MIEIAKLLQLDWIGLDWIGLDGMEWIDAISCLDPCVLGKEKGNHTVATTCGGADIFSFVNVLVLARDKQ